MAQTLRGAAAPGAQWVHTAGCACPHNAPSLPRFGSQACALFPSLSPIHIHCISAPSPTPMLCCHCLATGDPKAKADGCSSQHFKSMTSHSPHIHQKETKASCFLSHPVTFTSALPSRPVSPTQSVTLLWPSPQKQCTQVPRADS